MTYIERSLKISRKECGHAPLLVTVTDMAGAMPISLRTDSTEAEEVWAGVWLRWSEWDEVRDHIELVAPMMRPDGDEYVVCNATPGLVPYDALPCILEQGHGERGEPDEPVGTSRHYDRRGRSWQ